MPAMPRLAEPDPPLPELLTIELAVAAGMTRDQVRQRVRSGAWTTVGRGVYLRSSGSGTADLTEFARARLDHLARARAAALRHAGTAIAFRSAALEHSLPILGRMPPPVELLTGPGRWTGTRAGTTVRYSPLLESHVLLTPVPVTTAARTWFDIARTRPLADALAAGDAGLRGGSFTLVDLEAIIDEGSSTRGFTRPPRVLPHLDATRESPLESASWAYFVRYDLPLPAMQQEFTDRLGHLVGRVDFWWERARLVGECDGRVKYLTGDDLYREKLREDALRALGLQVVRWGWRDLSGAALADRLTAALSRR